MGMEGNYLFYLPYGRLVRAHNVDGEFVRPREIVGLLK